MAEHVKTVVKTALITVPVCITALDVFGYMSKVDGVSMQPTLNPRYGKHDYVFSSTWKARRYPFERGEIISFTSPRNPRERFVKRIIALEGDTVRTLSYKNRIVEVPQGHCWVEGDHYGYSFDSNMFGPVPMGLIKAKVTHICWPPSRFQKLKTFLPDPSRVESNHYKNYTSNSKSDLNTDKPLVNLDKSSVSSCES